MRRQSYGIFVVPHFTRGNETRFCPKSEDGVIARRGEEDVIISSLFPFLVSNRSAQLWVFFGGEVVFVHLPPPLFSPAVPFKRSQVVPFAQFSLLLHRWLINICIPPSSPFPLQLTSSFSTHSSPIAKSESGKRNGNDAPFPHMFGGGAAREKKAPPWFTGM